MLGSAASSSSAAGGGPARAVAKQGSSPKKRKGLGNKVPDADKAGVKPSGAKTIQSKNPGKGSPKDSSCLAPCCIDPVCVSRKLVCLPSIAQSVSRVGLVSLYRVLARSVECPFTCHDAPSWPVLLLVRSRPSKD